jgi:hypothetical protein
MQSVKETVQIRVLARSILFPTRGLASRMHGIRNGPAPLAAWSLGCLLIASIAAVCGSREQALFNMFLISLRITWEVSPLPRLRTFASQQRSCSKGSVPVSSAVTTMGIRSSVSLLIPATKKYPPIIFVLSGFPLLASLGRFSLKAISTSTWRECSSTVIRGTCPATSHR